MLTFVLFYLRIVYRFSQAFQLRLERRKSIPRSPALYIITPEYLTVLIRLNAPRSLRHRELDIGPGRRVLTASSQLLINQVVPRAAILRVMRIRRRIRILRLRRIEIENLQAFGLQIALGIHHLKLNRTRRT